MISGHVDTSTIIRLCKLPIIYVRQVFGCISDVESEGEDIFYGGPRPVYCFYFGEALDYCLAVSASSYELVFCICSGDDKDAQVIRFANDGVRPVCPEFTYSGMFDLRDVVCPVPEWRFLEVSRVVVIETVVAPRIIGLCFSLAFGTRIGMFVNEFPHLTLTFNHSCEGIIDQARHASNLELVRITEHTLLNGQGKTPLDKVDWYDWLRES